jgi:GTP pyrophosphokinase
MEDTGHLVTRIVSLDYELKGGEIVDIMVNRTVHPTRDWLSFARTTAARTRIRRYLKTYEREINLQLGRERLDFALKSASLGGVEQVDEWLQPLREDLAPVSAPLKKYSTRDDVYVALGREDLRVEEVMDYLMPLLLKRDLPAQEHERPAQLHNGHYQRGALLRTIKLAHCCYPIPGDAIVGYPGTRGMLVHRSDCPFLRRKREGAHVPIVVKWPQIGQSSYQVPITIVAHDRAGLLRDVAAIVTDAGINMTSVASATTPTLQKAVIKAILEISAGGEVGDQLERLLRRLRQVKNVMSVERKLHRK